MQRKITITLWVAALIVGAFMVYQRHFGPTAVVEMEDDGRLFVEVPWKHLPHIRPFRMVERSGKPFESATLGGKPYVVCFFFVNCPTICRDLNAQVKRLTEQFRGQDLTFLCISVDPVNDTPEVLRKYAEDYDADPKQWLFLTGKPHVVRQIGEQQFQVIVDPAHHTEDILLIDRWGRYRDRFEWDSPKEMKRFAKVAREVIREERPPLSDSVTTRNAIAGKSHHDLPRVSWLSDFHLTDQDNGDFFSRDLTGQVWIANFFFTNCPDVCPKQMEFLRSLETEIEKRSAHLVSITTDPVSDTPARLRQYAREQGAGSAWHFLTGPKDYIRRLGSEFLGISAEGEHHSSLLVVVDRWGNVRQKIDWRAADARASLLEWIDRLSQEDTPAAGLRSAL